MNKELLLELLLKRIKDDEYNVNSGIDSKLSSKEYDFIENIAEKNIEKNVINPPEYLINKIKANAFSSKEENKISFYKQYKNLIKVLSFSFSFFVIIIGFWVINKKAGEPQMLVKVSENYVPVKTGKVFVKEGIQIENKSEGEMAYSESDLNNVYLKSGDWQINTEHEKLDKEHWFHYPGGGVKPIGTKFSINIKKENVTVNLKEGKIQVYYIDENKEIKSAVYEAPYNGNFVPLEETLDLKKTTEIIKKLNEINTKEKSLEEKTEDENKKAVKRKLQSKYLKLINKNVALMLKNGDRISGTLNKIKNSTLILSTNLGELTIKEVDVSSVIEITE
ncbi:MAG: hypothetical protein OEZ22_09980 [Spirochaetia bacterium]|nr:hypothetical protein [Spirochaetia bacterium]